jgi:hypothetical protein
LTAHADCPLCATAAAIWESATPDRPWSAEQAASAEVEAPLPEEPDAEMLERRAQDWIERTYR